MPGTIVNASCARSRTGGWPGSVTTVPLVEPEVGDQDVPALEAHPHVVAGDVVVGARELHQVRAGLRLDVVGRRRAAEHDVAVEGDHRAGRDVEHAEHRPRGAERVLRAGSRAADPADAGVGRPEVAVGADDGQDGREPRGRASAARRGRWCGARPSGGRRRGRGGRCCAVGGAGPRRVGGDRVLRGRAAPARRRPARRPAAARAASRSGPVRRAVAAASCRCWAGPAGRAPARAACSGSGAAGGGGVGRSTCVSDVAVTCGAFTCAGGATGSGVGAAPSVTLAASTTPPCSASGEPRSASSPPAATSRTPSAPGTARSSQVGASAASSTAGPAPPLSSARALPLTSTRTPSPVRPAIAKLGTLRSPSRTITPSSASTPAPASAASQQAVTIGAARVELGQQHDVGAGDADPGTRHVGERCASLRNRHRCAPRSSLRPPSGRDRCPPRYGPGARCRPRSGRCRRRCPGSRR